MAKYRVLETSFINNQIAQEGDIVEYDGVPSDNLEPIDKAAQKAAEEGAQADLEAIARQKVAAAGAEPDAVDTAAAISAAAEAAETALQQQAGAAGLV